MKVKQVFGALSALAIGFAAQSAVAAAWRVVGSEGVRQFVAVEGQASEAVLRQAAASLCVAGKPCMLLFWTDPAQAATRTPLTAAQRAALAAQYTRNPATGHEGLLLRCGPEAPAKGNCLK